MITLVDGKVKVAIADDHLGIRKGVRLLLEQLPEVVVVGEAEDGQEAIEIVETACPEILILDINMPVMDGLEVLSILSERHLKLRVIIMSAYDDRIHKELTIAMGACNFISKTDIDQLIDVLRETEDGRCGCA